MNSGAQQAQGVVLYFLHVDTLPPLNFDHFILKAIAKGHKAGCFRMQFDTPNPFLKLFAWLTRINHPLCRGGDQSLFVERKIFEQIQRFNEAYTIYEDIELIQRLYKQTKFRVIPASVITSARKYKAAECNSNYYLEYRKLQNRVSHYFEEHLNLKTEVYNYAGTVLKRRKPVSWRRSFPVVETVGSYGF